MTGKQNLRPTYDQTKRMGSTNSKGNIRTK